MNWLSNWITGNQEAAEQDLRDWEQQTGEKLPLTAQEIANYEALGYLVDLETGELSRDPEIDGLYSEN